MALPVRRYWHAVLNERGRVVAVGDSEADAWETAEGVTQFRRCSLRRAGFRMELREASTIPAYLLPSARVMPVEQQIRRSWRAEAFAIAFVLAIVVAIINY
jgi:hypothetical protein